MDKLLLLLFGKQGTVFIFFFFNFSQFSCEDFWQVLLDGVLGNGMTLRRNQRDATVIWFDIRYDNFMIVSYAGR